MRIRTIKPEFWSHPIMVTLSDEARLGAIGLLNIADDEGYFWARPAQVRSLLWPLDEDSSRTRRVLSELESVGWITVTDHPTHGPIGLVVNFRKHQRIDRPTSSKIGPYVLDESSTSPRRVLDDRSCPEQGTGNREQGGGGEAPARERASAEDPPPPPLSSSFNKSKTKTRAQRFADAIQAGDLMEILQAHGALPGQGDDWTEWERDTEGHPPRRVAFLLDWGSRVHGEPIRYPSQYRAAGIEWDKIPIERQRDLVQPFNERHPKPACAAIGPSLPADPRSGDGECQGRERETSSALGQDPLNGGAVEDDQDLSQDGNAV